MRPTKDEVMAFLKPTPVTKEELDGLRSWRRGTTRFTANG